MIETAPPDGPVAPGDVVVPTVRRPLPDGTNACFEGDEPDMAPPEATVVRGIAGAHGFMAEYFTSPVADPVVVPESLAPFGFLDEPISVAEEAFELARASRSTFTWATEPGLVIGKGPVGPLGRAMLDGRGYGRTYCVGRRDRPDPTSDAIESLGGTYVDSRETPVDAFADVHEPVDLAVEATGHAQHAFEVAGAPAPNGVATLLGLPDDWTFEVDGGRLHRVLVLRNKALLGGVDANRRHFESADRTLASMPSGFLDSLVTNVHPATAVEDGFGEPPADETPMRTAVEFVEA